jgi:hypothetical protein
MRVAAEHTGTRLRQDLPDEFDHLGQFRDGASAARSSHRRLGLAHHRPGDSHEAPVQGLIFAWLLARIRAEETLLRTQFGDEYDAYCRRKSRLIPGFY